jgi:hypothetical protein
MVVFGDISIAQCTVQKIGIQQRIAFGIDESSRVVLSLLNPEDEIPMFCMSSGVVANFAMVPKFEEPARKSTGGW